MWDSASVSSARMWKSCPFSNAARLTCRSRRRPNRARPLMPELNRDQRFLPCLLDRLRDDEPGKKEESRVHRVVSLQRYKEGVIRDLQWLLNASAHLPVAGRTEAHVGDYPEAKRSVL